MDAAVESANPQPLVGQGRFGRDAALANFF
jgi:hypothetical protein